MAKPGRNDPCPCGSGKKYKRCCLDKDVAAELEHERLAAAAWRPIVDVNIVNRFDEFDTDDAEDELTANSNAAVDLVDEGRLDENNLHAELGQIVAGLKPGRETPEETILLWHRGLSILDIAVGALILRRAQDADAGTMLRYR